MVICTHKQDKYCTVDGKKLCYDCCAEYDKEILRNSDVHLGYMIKRNGEWVYTNGTGTLAFRIVHWTGNHNWWGVKQHYGYFFFEDNWYLAKMVTGGFTDCARARKLKHLPDSRWDSQWYDSPTVKAKYGIQPKEYKL